MSWPGWFLLLEWMDSCNKDIQLGADFVHPAGHGHTVCSPEQGERKDCKGSIFLMHSARNSVFFHITTTPRFGEFKGKSAC
jgi:hypothetical protein